MAAALIMGGLVFYIPFVWFELTLPLRMFERFEIICQKYFEVVPVDLDDQAEETNEKTD